MAQRSHPEPGLAVIPRPGPGHPVLVAGQDGSLGRAVLARLRARGLETWGTTRRPPPWEPLTLPLDLSVRNARLPEPPRSGRRKVRQIARHHG